MSRAGGKVHAIDTALARSRVAKAFRFQCHQTFGRKADHLAQKCRVGALLQKLAKGDLVIGHRGVLGFELCLDNPTLPNAAAVTTAVDK